MTRACSTHGAKRNLYRALVRKLEERDHSKVLDISGKIIFWWILEE
jgi:hypothetical protein